MRRVVGLLAVAVLGVGPAVGLGGCRSCDVDCAPAAAVGGPDEVVIAELLGEREDVLRLRTEDGETRRVRLLTGRASALDVGSRYRFPLYDERGELPHVSLPSDCGCGGRVITHADGSQVDQSVWSVTELLEEVAVRVLAVFAVLVALGIVVRHVRPFR